jgi:hypothetical protein
MLFEKLSRSLRHHRNLRRLHSSTQPLPLSITVNHDRISILDSPNDYLNSILKLISRSTQKITLSALYFGTGEPERQIIAAIHDALSDKKRPNLTCTCILDYSRTMRPPECNDKNSNLDIFQPLLEAFGERMNVLLYRMPDHLGIFYSLIPKQLSEILGVYHCKFCMFDQNIILTGANISSEYLTNRQDRYMMIEECSQEKKNEKTAEEDSELLIFLEAFVKILDPHCCHVTHTAKQNLNRNLCSNLQIAEPVYKHGNVGNTLGLEIKNLLQKEHSRKKEEILGGQKLMTSFHPLVQHSKCGVFSESHHLSSLLFPHTTPVLSSEERSLGHFNEITEPSPENIPQVDANTSDSYDDRNTSQWNRMVIASPYPSFLPLFMSSLLSASYSQTIHTHTHLNSNPSQLSVVCLSSNVDVGNSIALENKSDTNDKNKNDRNKNDRNENDRNENDRNEKDRNENNNYNNNNNDNNNDNNNNYNDNLSREGCTMKFIIADEKAHGFHKGKGMKKLIPKMHTHAFQTALSNSQKTLKNGLNQDYFSALSIEECAGLYDNVSICPYRRAGWTFHVKGIWLFSSPPKLLPLPLSLPSYMTDTTCTASIHTLQQPLNISTPNTPLVNPYPHLHPANTANPAGSGYFRPLAATYIGSSNLGERSCFRDFELGFVLRTNCPVLTKQLSEECSRIEEHSSDLSVGLNEYVGGLKHATWYTSYLTKLLRSFL